MRQVLESVGPWEILEAANGREAVAMALEIRPNLIILDLAMPVKDGLTTARELVKLLPEIPILMHTLYWSPRIELEAMKAGVRKAVPKSESTTIITAVQELLGTEPPAAPGTAVELAPINTSPLDLAAAASALETKESGKGGAAGLPEKPGDGAGQRGVS